MKSILFLFRFAFKLVLFSFVFGALGMALLQFYDKTPSDFLTDLKEGMVNSPRLNHGTSIQQIDAADRPFIIAIPSGGDTKQIDTRQIANIESINQKDLRFNLCLDEECFKDAEINVKRLSLVYVRNLLQEKGITCFYPLKKDLINFKYYDELISITTMSGYKYEAILLNDQQINIPKDRKTDFERALNQCDTAF